MGQWQVGRFIGRVGLAAALGLMASALQARDTYSPAERPPAGYGGQQYVDSEGCLFMRAGHGGQTVWIPRVTRAGVPMCGYPPSGIRVPVAGDAGTGKTSRPPADAGAKGAAPGSSGGAEGFVVAVGSFGIAANANKAEARLKALGYRVGRVAGGSAALVTVFAGPFSSAAAAEDARSALRNAGFPGAVVMGG